MNENGVVKNGPVDEGLFNRLMAVNADLMARAGLAASLGMSFGGKRDLYKVLGYKTELEFDDYFAMYDRQELAGKVVDKPAEDTWRMPPIIKDGDRTDTEFCKALRTIDSNVGLWSFMKRVDQITGIGQYGILLIGLTGGTLDLPLLKGSLKGPEDVLYLSVFDESQAEVTEIVEDTSNKRFGLPKIYKIDLGVAPSGKRLGKVRVHWSRVLHVAENLLADEVHGRPRLKRPYNRLQDLEKVVGGSSEAIWKLIYKGVVTSTKDGYSLPEDETMLNEKIGEYIHGLRRWLNLEGMDAQVLGGESIDSSNWAMMLVRLIAATSGIPWQMLIGAERGDVANKQDQATWAGQIKTRRTNYANPLIRTLIARFVSAGAVPPPQSGDYVIEWEPLFEMTEEEEADLASTRASAMETAAGVAVTGLITDEEARGFGGLPPEPVRTVAEAGLDAEDEMMTELEE